MLTDVKKGNKKKMNLHDRVVVEKRNILIQGELQLGNVIAVQLLVSVGQEMLRRHRGDLISCFSVKKKSQQECRGI